jgi:hypothetical protein
MSGTSATVGAVAAVAIVVVGAGLLVLKRSRGLSKLQSLEETVVETANPVFEGDMDMAGSTFYPDIHADDPDQGPLDDFVAGVGGDIW